MFLMLCPVSPRRRDSGNCTGIIVGGCDSFLLSTSLSVKHTENPIYFSCLSGLAANILRGMSINVGMLACYDQVCHPYYSK